MVERARKQQERREEDRRGEGGGSQYALHGSYFENCVCSKGDPCDMHNGRL